jgi:hypothetical protein
MIKTKIKMYRNSTGVYTVLLAQNCDRLRADTALVPVSGWPVWELMQMSALGKVLYPVT